MKGKGKGTSTKVVPKEVTPAIQGLGVSCAQIIMPQKTILKKSILKTSSHQSYHV